MDWVTINQEQRTLRCRPLKTMTSLRGGSVDCTSGSVGLYWMLPKLSDSSQGAKLLLHSLAQTTHNVHFTHYNHCTQTQLDQTSCRWSLSWRSNLRSLYVSLLIEIRSLVCRYFAKYSHKGETWFSSNGLQPHESTKSYVLRHQATVHKQQNGACN